MLPENASSRNTEINLLHTLARLYRVQTTYVDAAGKLRESSPEGIVCVLRALGAPLASFADVGEALRLRRRELWQRGMDAVLLAWDGRLPPVRLRTAAGLGDRDVAYEVILENGTRLTGRCADAGVEAEKEIDGCRYVARRLVVPETFPLGYHRLFLQTGKRGFEAYLFSSPRRAYGEPGSRTWGVFSPVYALSSEKSWGAGDFSDLQTLSRWVDEQGGDVVATLPLLAGFLDEPFNPSPYAPVSRLFWNELYLDVLRIPEFERCPVARAVARSAAFRAEVELERASSLIDYRRVMRLKRMVLEELARCFFKDPTERREQFDGYLQSHPRLEDYAAFRAKTERERAPWFFWPEAARNGRLAGADYDEAAKRYHLYVQWQADQQMSAFRRGSGDSGSALYLDFPLGVNRDGYDVWRERSVFALQASGGAPPDLFFTKGQNWGFPPLQPEALRRQGYRYYIESLRHHLRYSGMLRIDHVIGLHRLYWVPDGCDPADGVFVRYPAEEFYAVLNLESHRHQARIVGENLGTVPAYVNAALAEHNIHGMYVGQFEIAPDEETAVR
ncbi:MAG TPA: 4-alpha-glucanotransferase, partial [Candidatus Eisenbacteria bacterium]|nr:4-alpha-glucanotransferase [Candidatus Eisenbacteria bacterium]